MAWGPCEYCGYSECNCGMAAEPQWIATSDRLPENGKEVLWYLQVGDSLRACVGKLDGQELDAGLDLNIPLPRVAFWMELPAAPAVRRRRKA